MALRAWTRPLPLRAGSVIAVAAPASFAERDVTFRGLAWLATRYRIKADQRILAKIGYLAGVDAARASVLAGAMVDPEVAAIVCVRGGYGSLRIVDDLPWSAFAERPKWLVGFSDITVLHHVANAHGIATVHGPNVSGLGRSIHASERASLLACLEDAPLAPWTSLVPIVPGKARGPLIGGNLALLQALAAADRLSIPDGAIVVLEDVTEPPYRVDRMLTSLRVHLSRASAVVFGDFTDCPRGPDGTTVADVLRERAPMLGVPVVMGGPFGHGAPNHAFRLGQVADLDGATLSFGVADEH